MESYKANTQETSVTSVLTYCSLHFARYEHRYSNLLIIIISCIYNVPNDTLIANRIHIHTEYVYPIKTTILYTLCRAVNEQSNSGGQSFKYLTDYTRLWLKTLTDVPVSRQMQFPVPSSSFM